MKKFFFLITLFLPFELQAQTSSQGELRLESRFFNNDDQASTQDFGVGLAGRLEVTQKNGGLTSRLQVFSRVDDKDPNRQRFNLEELYLQYETSAFEMFAGWKVLNWSTAEAFHPTDVINSRNFDGTFENAEKLGEAMIGGNYVGDSFNLSLFYMPFLVTPQLPASSNRLSFTPMGVPTAKLQFLDNDGQFMKSEDTAEQWALYLQYLLGEFEINASWAHHFDRTDIKVIPLSTFFPIMTPVDHYGLGLNYVYESWIFKSEMVYRDFQETITIPSLGATLTQRDYGLISLATEYLLPHTSGSETSFILEFQELVGVEENFRYGISPFQRDVLFGVRHALNDEKGKEIFLSIIADVERSREILLSGSYTQRLSDVWKVKTSFRYIDAQPSSNFDFTGFRQLNNDHQLNIELSRFF